MSLELTPQLFAIFSQLVESECGLHYGTSDRSLFESKLVTQAMSLGYESLLDYYYRLRYDDPDGTERRALVQALVVHETYLFRESAALEALCDHYLVDALAKRGRARVWSAACSTGEEPTTLAILLANRGLLDKVEIVASDISAAAIAKARSGTFGRRAVRDSHPHALSERYITSTPTGFASVPAIRDAIRYSVVNLLDTERVRELGTFDAILCRNVLIYFRDAQIVKIVDVLAEQLVPGGVIVVGVSESLMRFGTRLVCEERGGAFAYRSVP